VKPSVKAARRYARAFLDLAGREGRCDEVSRDLASLARLADESADWRRFVSQDGLPRERRRLILERIVRDALHPLTWSLLRLLESKRRLGLLRIVGELFAEGLEEARGVRRVTVTSAFDLGTRSQAAVREALGRRCGDALQVRFVTDRGLLAGFAWQIGDTRHDRSAAGALGALRKKWAGA
jgi:ATP synthase F1 delta subunit